MDSKTEHVSKKISSSPQKSNVLHQCTCYYTPPTLKRTTIVAPYRSATTNTKTRQRNVVMHHVESYNILIKQMNCSPPFTRVRLNGRTRKHRAILKPYAAYNES